MSMARKQRQIKEWGGVPGRKNSQVFAGGLGAASLPLIDGVDVDIYTTHIDTAVDGQHGGAHGGQFSVEITVEQDKDLTPHVQTFKTEDEAILYARKYLDFLMQVLNNT